jgi:pimeloyl-ACP methyl ester carboxylesterase
LQRRDPGRISRLVLIDAPALPQRLSPLVAFMQQPVLPYALLTAVPSRLVTALALAPASAERLERRYSPADVEAYAAPFESAAARHAYIQTSLQIAPDDFPSIIKAYRTLKPRTLLVWCSRDSVVPLATGQALARILPHARLDQLSGCNHSPPDEAPDALARTLLRFLKS